MSEVPLWWGTMQAIKDGRKAKVCPPSSFPSLLSSLELSDTTIYGPCIRALLGTASPQSCLHRLVTYMGPDCTGW